MPSSNSSQQMQVQPQSQSQPNPLNNLQKFLNNYNRFLEQNLTIELNPQTVLSDIALNILQPPKSAPQTQNYDLHSLYEKGKNLPSIFGKDSREVQDMVSRLKKLKQDKLYETILFIQQLNFKLNKQYEHQINRGVQNGVYNKKNGGQGSTQYLTGNLTTENLDANNGNNLVEKVQKILQQHD